MSGRTKTHPTKKDEPKIYKITIELPNKTKRFSFISKNAFNKLEAFLIKYAEDESTLWNELAAERIVQFGKAGLALRGARIREGYTQKELAKKTGISQENISRMENGKRPIGERVAKKLSKTLKIDLKLLLS